MFATRVAATVSLLLAASPSAAFTAQNGLIVTERQPGFHVAWNGNAGAPAFWCAAGDYVIGSLGLPTDTQIYRVSPPVRRSGEGIDFGFDPAAAMPTGLLRLFGGRGLSAAYARQFCDTPAGR
ncbi:hypothetical protein OCGS_0067 [Oceaniovalibus guishaninsula JLT2003]|uniref:Uncharacterized protein n=1 Tax=Oceaniovalibus guishaninsula JLT2003 TaxID=1231392 RepID=K2GTF3_9RHOB|nr:hypothetical protein [Oceaniovalibus guishaninsula]EKE45841.1 hypothetical protein OCGS_0067 [Oceaniovalibus guishaninsula JLT2003]